jgi:hypothetical protein
MNYGGSSSLAAVAIMLTSLAAVGGCSGDSPDNRVAAMNDSNIKRLANLYQAFRLRKNMTGPKDEAMLKQFIQQEMPRRNLERMLVNPDDVDALFTSERDGAGRPLWSEWRTGIVGSSGVRARRPRRQSTGGVHQRSGRRSGCGALRRVDERCKQTVW